MTERLRPTRVPASNPKSSSDRTRQTSECRECRWAVPDDLDLTWVLGMPLTLCKNPWACWERQIVLGEHLGERLGDVAERG